MRPIDYVKGITFGLLLAVAVSYAGAAVFTWTSPACDPPNCNTPPPINAGGAPQGKAGFLGVNGFGLVDGTQGEGKVLVSNDLGIASWGTPEAAAAGVTGTEVVNAIRSSLTHKVSNLVTGCVEGSWCTASAQCDTGQKVIFGSCTGRSDDKMLDGQVEAGVDSAYFEDGGRVWVCEKTTGGSIRAQAVCL